MYKGKKEGNFETVRILIIIIITHTHTRTHARTHTQTRTDGILTGLASPSACHTTWHKSCACRASWQTSTGLGSFARRGGERVEKVEEDELVLDKLVEVGRRVSAE
jgi:hypothetical protein